eukprot:scaffold8123_cov66-Phaeocystis_antarctica.AAC.3
MVFPLSKARLARVSSRPTWDPACWPAWDPACQPGVGGPRGIRDGCLGSASLGFEAVRGIREAQEEDEVALGGALGRDLDVGGGLVRHVLRRREVRRVPWPLKVVRVAAEAAEGHGRHVDEAHVAQPLVREEHVRAVRPHLLHLAPHRGGGGGLGLRLTCDLLPPIAHLVRSLERVGLLPRLDELIAHVHARTGDPHLVVRIADLIGTASRHETVVEVVCL